MADTPRFYFDESVDLAVSEQLALAGLDAVSAHSLDKLGDEDPSHLQRAVERGRVLCACDADFIVLAQEGVEHAGIGMRSEGWKKGTLMV